MKHVSKISSSAGLILVCLVLVACSGLAGGNGGGGTGSLTIGGSISGYTGSNLVLEDNGSDTLSVAAGSKTFTFTKTVASGGAFSVTVQTQPTNPAQTCTVTTGTGTGTATANVSTVAVVCTTNPVTATIGGMVTNLAPNTSVILQDNGGDSLTITANGPFTFKTPVTGPTDAYAVTVLTQPTGPN